MTAEDHAEPTRFTVPNAAGDVTFDALRATLHPHLGPRSFAHPAELSDQATIADACNAIMASAGEVSNLTKKMRRHETGTATDRDPTLDHLTARTVAHLIAVTVKVDALAAQWLTHPMGHYAARKFNAVSVRENFPERLEDTPHSPLTLRALSTAAASRRARWHTPDTIEWGTVDWSNALVGEAGEVATVVGQIREHQHNTQQAAAARESACRALSDDLGDELADVLAYVDLLLNHLGYGYAAVMTEHLTRCATTPLAHAG